MQALHSLTLRIPPALVSGPGPRTLWGPYQSLSTPVHNKASSIEQYQRKFLIFKKEDSTTAKGRRGGMQETNAGKAERCCRLLELCVHGQSTPRM